jgi:hypothetical protein
VLIRGKWQFDKFLEGNEINLSANELKHLMTRKIQKSEQERFVRICFLARHFKLNKSNVARKGKSSIFSIDLIWRKGNGKSLKL